MLPHCSCIGLSVLLRLEYLDLSHNAISRVSGLEHMADLRTLKLQHNRIVSVKGIRLLSYNR